jgi:CheY-like chemotaxis protein
MGYRILALVEDNIATTLLLATRLGDMGHDIEVLSDPEEFGTRLAAQRFDWLLVDGDVAHAAGKGFLDVLSADRRDARIVWFGRRPRHGAIAITAHFTKPISHAELSRYFSSQMPAKATTPTVRRAAVRARRHRSSE